MAFEPLLDDDIYSYLVSPDQDEGEAAPEEGISDAEFNTPPDETIELSAQSRQAKGGLSDEEMGGGETAGLSDTDMGLDDSEMAGGPRSPFDEPDEGYGAWETFHKKAERATPGFLASLPIMHAAGLAGAGVGAAITGPAAPAGAALGYVGGAVAGGLGGGYLTQKAAEWLYKQLGLTEPGGYFDENKMEQAEQEHPIASILGETAPAALGFRFDKGVTAAGRIANAALQGGLSAGQSMAQGDDLEHTLLRTGANAAAGALFTTPRAIPQKLMNVGNYAPFKGAGDFTNPRYGTNAPPEPPPGSGGGGNPQGNPPNPGKQGSPNHPAPPEQEGARAETNLNDVTTTARGVAAENARVNTNVTPGNTQSYPVRSSRTYPKRLRTGANDNAVAPVPGEAPSIAPDGTPIRSADADFHDQRAQGLIKEGPHDDVMAALEATNPRPVPGEPAQGAMQAGPTQGNTTQLQPREEQYVTGRGVPITPDMARKQAYNYLVNTKKLDARAIGQLRQQFNGDVVAAANAQGFKMVRPARTAPARPEQPATVSPIRPQEAPRPEDNRIRQPISEAEFGDAAIRQMGNERFAPPEEPNVAPSRPTEPQASPRAAERSSVTGEEAPAGPTYAHPELPDIKIDRTKMVPTVAELSPDGKTVFLDQRIPPTIDVGGKKLDPALPLGVRAKVWNEVYNKPKVTRAMAKDVAMQAEEAWLKSRGYDYDAYRKALREAVRGETAKPGDAAIAAVEKLLREQNMPKVKQWFEKQADKGIAARKILEAQTNKRGKTQERGYATARVPSKPATVEGTGTTARTKAEAEMRQGVVKASQDAMTRFGRAKEGGPSPFSKAGKDALVARLKMGVETVERAGSYRPRDLTATPGIRWYLNAKRLINGRMTQKQIARFLADEKLLREGGKEGIEAAVGTERIKGDIEKGRNPTVEAVETGGSREVAPEELQAKDIDWNNLTDADLEQMARAKAAADEGLTRKGLPGQEKGKPAYEAEAEARRAKMAAQKAAREGKKGITATVKKIGTEVKRLAKDEEGAVAPTKRYATDHELSLPKTREKEVVQHTVDGDTYTLREWTNPGGGRLTAWFDDAGNMLSPADARETGLHVPKAWDADLKLHPATENKYAPGTRNFSIYEAVAKGAKIADVAEQFGISKTRAGQIVKTTLRREMERSKPYEPSLVEQFLRDERGGMSGDAFKKLREFFGRKPSDDWRAARAQTWEQEYARNLDDRLYQMDKQVQNNRSKLRAIKDSWADSIRKEKPQGKLYKAIETGDESHLTPDEKNWLRHEYEPLFADVQKMAKFISERDPNFKFLDGLRINRIPRRVFDALEPRDGFEADPVAGFSRSMKMRTPQMYDRTFFEVVNPTTGERKVVSQTEDGDMHIHTRGVTSIVRDPKMFDAVNPKKKVPFDWELGSEYVDSGGKKWKLEIGDTSNIERHAKFNDGKFAEYFKNAGLSVLKAHDELFEAMQHMKFIDELKNNDPKWEQLTTMSGNEAADKEWTHSRTHLKPFDKYYMHPDLRDVFDHYSQPGLGGNSETLSKFRNLSRGITKLMFWIPTAHINNVAAHWFVGRGWDWMTPKGYQRLAATSMQAIRSVIKQDALQNLLRDNGAGTVYGGVLNENFLQKVAKDLDIAVEKSGQWNAIAREFGFKGVKDMADAVYDASKRVMWSVNDMFLTQQILENMQKGMDIKTAINHAERHIPNYRTPAKIMGSRLAAEYLSDPGFTAFGRYHYGVFNSYAHMVKSIVNGTPAQKWEALGNLAMVGVLMFAVKPVLDKMAQYVTGEDDAEIRARGPIALPHHIIQAIKGEATPESVVKSVLTPSPLISALQEARTNKDFADRDIVEPGDINQLFDPESGADAGERARAAGRIGVQAGEHALRSLYSPYGTIAGAYGREQPLADAIRDMALDIKNPSEKAQKWMRVQPRRNESKARHRAQGKGSRGMFEDLYNNYLDR